jgi:hypothetical protein
MDCPERSVLEICGVCLAVLMPPGKYGVFLMTIWLEYWAKRPQKKADIHLLLLVNLHRKRVIEPAVYIFEAIG